MSERFEQNMQEASSSLETAEETRLAAELQASAERIGRMAEERKPMLSEETLQDFRARFQKIADRTMATGVALGIAVGAATFAAPHVSEIPPANALWLLQGMEGLDSAIAAYKNFADHAQEAQAAASGLINMAVVSGLGMAATALTKIYAFARQPRA